jgi:hypothetical protein
VDRYSFIVMDSHHLLLAGLPAHPIPAVHGTAMEPRRSTKAVASAPALRGGADSAWIRSSDGVVTAPQNLGRTMSTALFGGAPRDG